MMPARNSWSIAINNKRSRHSAPEDARRARRGKGFTLFEILVVLFVVTVMTGMVVVSLPSFSRGVDFDKETQRLSLLFSMAQNAAVLDSIEFGFKKTDLGYKFMRYDDGNRAWRDVAAPFHERTLVDKFQLLLKTDDKKGARRLGEAAPSVLILSSGDITPFTLTLTTTSGDESRSLRSDGYGTLVWDSNDKK